MVNLNDIFVQTSAYFSSHSNGFKKNNDGHTFKHVNRIEGSWGSKKAQKYLAEQESNN